MRLYREEQASICAYYLDALIYINYAHDVSMKQISLSYSSIVCLQEVYSYI